MPIDAIYIHIPFCTRRCDYCAFPSSVYNPEVAAAYLAALNFELEARALGAAPETIFIGGGTPTCLQDNQFNKLLEMAARIDKSRLREFTVEANPGSFAVEKVMRLRAAGVTRLSLGVQTFSEAGLTALGRKHTPREARAAISLAREAGCDDLSIDLIYAWPGQTLSQWREDLSKAVDLGITHISCYCLSYEKGTELDRRRMHGLACPVGEEAEKEMFEFARVYLPHRGFSHYEISNFSLPGHECKHNMHYWRGSEYLGLGAGAYSYLKGQRSSNTEAVEDYINRIFGKGMAQVWDESLEADKRARELAVIWLRMREGIDPALFKERSGFDLSELLVGEGEHLLRDGWLIWENGRLKLAEQSLVVADAILADLV